MLCSEALDKFLEYEKIIGSVVPTQNYILRILHILLITLVIKI